MIEKISRKKDIYRPAFCASSFYLNQLTNFEIIQKNIAHLDQVVQITIWVITCLCLRRPTMWYAGLREQTLSSTSAPEFLLHNLFNQLQINWPLSLPKDILLDEFCRTVRIAPVPRAAQNALYHFLTHNYPLQILCYEPEPRELLKLQMRGKRVLTFESDFYKWSTLKYGARDPLSFWIHDLIHAEHFLANPQNLHGQIGFYKFIDEILSNKILDKNLLNTEFNTAFSYLISDMNSHPIHLIKTLKAHLQIHKIDKNDEKTEEFPWERVTKMPIVSAYSEIEKILCDVNTCNFTEADAKKLTAYFELDLYELTLS